MTTVKEWDDGWNKMSKLEQNKFWAQEISKLNRCQYCNRLYTKNNTPIMVFLNYESLTVCKRCYKNVWFGKPTLNTEKID